VASIAKVLCTTLKELGPNAPCWNWSGSNSTAGWVARRMAQETAVHRVDAHQIDGAVAADIDAALNVDDVDEFIDVFVGTPVDRPLGDAPILELVARDVR